MLHYTTEQLASVVALPIVTILLVWTYAIFHRNRKTWGPYDLPIVTLLVLSILRNLTILAYTLFVTLNHDLISLDYCSALVWIFNSIHTFQASSLTTLAVIGLFSVKLHRKQQQLRHFLTATHVIYHLFCLTMLCACVGVAAILARPDGAKFVIFDSNPCKFMPFDLDIKYNVFIIVLNVFLACVSLIAFGATCVNHFKIKKRGFDYLKKSNSDLSDLSLGLNNDQKNFYDTYTIQRGDQGYYEGQNHVHVPWNSDVSNISTTVSSTNSRRPCITQPVKNEEQRTGLETIHPVLIVCYLFYHLPLIVLCVYPDVIAPWPIAGVALWLGLIQDILIPIGLSIVDSRFCKWVSNVYKCSDKHEGDKLPHVGLDGKFRPFSSPPQSLEVSHNQRAMQTVEHRFPITNGSLYTSIDGRLPVIHNYRRHKDPRCVKPDYPRTEQGYQRHPFEYSCRSCEADLCPSHSNLHHLSPQYINKQLNLINKNPLTKRTSLSQESLRYIPENLYQEQVIKNSRNLIRLNKMRLCKSEDSLNDVTRNLKQVKINERHDYSSSDDDYLTDNNKNFDSLSSQSSYSITTEANCDFEFFSQNKEKSCFENVRLGSKRSLNNEVMYNRGKIQRSNSYMTLEDRNKKKNKKILRSNSKLSDCTHNIRHKIKSVEYLPNSNASTFFIEDVFYFNYPNQRKCGETRNYVGSVPDLKKVFISEYI